MYKKMWEQLLYVFARLKVGYGGKGQAYPKRGAQDNKSYVAEHGK